jgi:hypothetical protein
VGRRARRFEAVEEVLARFGPDSAEARRALLARIAEPSATTALLAEPTRAPCETGRPGSSGGSLVEAPRETSGDALPEVRARCRRAAGWTLEALIGWVCTELGVDAERVRAGGRRREESRARSVAGWLALHELGCTLAEVSQATGVTSPPMLRALGRGREIAGRLPRPLPPKPPGR